MSVREATQTDADAIKEFLMPHIESSMFLLGNLNRFEIGQSDHIHATRYVLEETNGNIVGISGLSNSNMIMVQAPFEVDNLAEFMRTSCSGIKSPNAIMGVTSQVSDMRIALDIDNLPTTLDDDEPLFSCDLAELEIPDTGGRNFELREYKKSDFELVADWRHAYNIETMGRPDTPESRAQSKEQTTNSFASNNHRLLLLDGEPAATTGFNSVLPECVQIGGVYTPPALRNNGYARTAVALHLNKAKANGVKQSVLFSANEAASRAYMSIGFKHIGQYSLVLFDKSNQPSDK